MSSRAKIILHLAGHDFHPVYAQAEQLIQWLGPSCACHTAESLAAFEHLAECDLLIMLGMYYSGWEGRYRPPGTVHQRALERYVAAGKPLLLHHGAIASYDDWPGFADLAGIGWNTQRTGASPVQQYEIKVLSSHPVVAGVNDFQLTDELYYDVALASWTRPDVHAASRWEQRALPAVLTIDGRPGGASRVAYVAPGGNMHAFVSDPVRRILLNSIDWCLGRT